jgi:hypothetical protein
VISMRLPTTFSSPVTVPMRFGTSSFMAIMIRAPQRRTCCCQAPRMLRTPPSVRPSRGTFGNAATPSSSTQRMNRFRLLLAGALKTSVFGHTAAPTPPRQIVYFLGVLNLILPDPLYFPLCSASHSVMPPCNCTCCGFIYVQAGVSPP